MDVYAMLDLLMNPVILKEQLRCNMTTNPTYYIKNVLIDQIFIPAEP